MKNITKISFILLLLTSCSIGLPMEEKKDMDNKEFRKGWYKYIDYVTDPLFINYESEEKINRIGTLLDEITGKSFEIAQSTFSYYRVSENLKSIDVNDILLDLPSWVYKEGLSSFSVDSNGIKGFTSNSFVSSSNSLLMKPSFSFYKEGGEVTFNTSYYVDGKKIETLKALPLYVVCEDVDVEEYFTFSNSNECNTLDSRTLLTSDLRIKCINRAVENPRCFKVDVHNKAMKEDSFMFSIYLSIGEKL